jgi:hypothetical protein
LAPKEDFVIRQGLLGLIVAVGLLAAPDSAGQSPPSGTGNDEDTIRAVIAATTDAFSRRDAKARPTASAS